MEKMNTDVDKVDTRRDRQLEYPISKSHAYLPRCKLIIQSIDFGSRSIKLFFYLGFLSFCIFVIGIDLVTAMVCVKIIEST